MTDADNLLEELKLESVILQTKLQQLQSNNKDLNGIVKTSLLSIESKNKNINALKDKNTQLQKSIANETESLAKNLNEYNLLLVNLKSLELSEASTLLDKFPPLLDTAQSFIDVRLKEINIATEK